MIPISAMASSEATKPPMLTIPFALPMCLERVEGPRQVEPDHRGGSARGGDEREYDEQPER